MKQLSPSDYESCLQLMSRSTTLCGVPVDPSSQAFEVSKQYLKSAYLDGTFGYQAFGQYGPDDSYDHMTALVLLCQSRQQPCFFVTKMYSYDGNKDSYVKQLLLDVVQLQETQYNLTRWYAAYPKDWLESYPRWGRQQLTEYEVRTELEVPANTRPPFLEFFNVLLARQLWPVDMVIRCFTKKEIN